MGRGHRRNTATLQVQGGTVDAVAFSPDGSTVATASDDGKARLWSAVTGQPITTLTGHTAPVESVAFNPQGTMLATASTDKTARLWTSPRSGTPVTSRLADLQRRFACVVPRRLFPVATLR